MQLSWLTQGSLRVSFESTLQVIFHLQCEAPSNCECWSSSVNVSRYHLPLHFISKHLRSSSSGRPTCSCHQMSWYSLDHQQLFPSLLSLPEDVLPELYGFNSIPAVLYQVYWWSTSQGKALVFIMLKYAPHMDPHTSWRILFIWPTVKVFFFSR